MTDHVTSNDTELAEGRAGDDDPSAVTPGEAAMNDYEGVSPAPPVTPLDLTSLALDRAGLMEFTEKFGGPHGLMRWVSMGAGAPTVPPQLHEIAEAAVRGEPIFFELHVGGASFRFDFR